MRRRAWVHIAATTLLGNSLRQTVHTYRVSVHQAAKLVPAFLRIARVTAGLVESNGSLPPGLWLASRAGWLPTTRISSGILRSVIEYGIPFTVWTFLSSSVAVYSTFMSLQAAVVTETFVTQWTLAILLCSVYGLCGPRKHTVCILPKYLHKTLNWASAYTRQMQ